MVNSVLFRQMEGAWQAKSAEEVQGPGVSTTFRGALSRDGVWSVSGPCLQALNHQGPQIKVVLIPFFHAVVYIQVLGLS